MKSYHKKAAALFASAAILSTCFMSGISEAAFEFSPDNTSDVAVNRLTSPTFGGVSYSVPEFKRLIDADGERFVPSVSYTAAEKSIDISGENGSLPASFDLRESGMMTSVKDQGSNGTCWAFAASASAETSLLSSIPSADLSELHSAYYAYYGDEQIDIGDCTIDDILDYGGNRDIIVNLWSQWVGPVSESILPYESAEALENGCYASLLYDKADYHLENAYMFDYTNDRSNFDNVNELIKQFVYEGNAVDVSFYSSNSTAYNKEEYASFCTEKPKKANHSVAIAGWDDNFPASSFGEYNGAVPKNNGAWLVKNSWGSTLGDYGYMWISYEDTSLCEFTVFDMSDDDNYSTIYNYDTFVPAQTMSAGEDTEEKYASYMANIFTAEQTEQIEAISTYINNAFTEYEITVYTGLSDASDPTSGKASAVTEGVSELTGYITIELDENVSVYDGELFSVEVKLYNNESNFVIPIETSMIIQDSETGGITELSYYTTFEQICRYTGRNESFFSEDGENWYDVTDENYVYNDEEKEELIESILELLEEEGESQEVIDEIAEEYRELFFSGDLMVIMGNISLKAFGNPVNTVDFSHISGAVASDEKVSLSAKGGADIYYTVNGGESQLYTEPIQITEEAVISATTDRENYTQREYYPAKSEFNAIGYSTRAGESVVVLEYAEKIDESHYVINLSGDIKSVRLFPVTAATVLMNGTEIEKNMPTEHIPLEYGSNEVSFVLSGGNTVSNTVTLIINRNVAEFDVETETVTIYGEISLTAPDGTVLVSGDSISAYPGEILTAEINGTAIEYTVPERAVLPECEIDFPNETLGSFDTESALYLEYSVSGAENYLSADKRLVQTGDKVSLMVIPGETLSLRIGAGGGKLAGEAVTYVIPEAVQAPESLPKCTEQYGIIKFYSSNTIEYGIISTPLTEEEFSAMSEKFGYTTEEFEKLMLKRYGASDKTKLLKRMTAEWGINETELTRDRTAEIAVRFFAKDGSFASQTAVYTISTDKYEKGDVNGDGIVNPVDATLALSQYAEISLNGNGILTQVQQYAADYDDSGVINPVDATYILIHYTDESFN